MKIVTTVENSKPTSSAFAESRRQMPYVAADVLTGLAKDAQAALEIEAGQVFDRPTDFTLRSFWRKNASKGNLEATVYVPDSDDQTGRQRREFLRPSVDATSARRQKRTEFLLTRLGALPAGWVTTPGKGAQLNANGNLGGPVYKQIINVLQIRGDAKQVSARSAKGAKRLGVASLFFVVAPGSNTRGNNGGWLPPGVWKHLPGGAITQILKFVRKAAYKKRLDVERAASGVANDNLPRRWADALAVIAQRFASKGKP